MLAAGRVSNCQILSSSSFDNLCISGFSFVRHNAPNYGILTLCTFKAWTATLGVHSVQPGKPKFSPSAVRTRLLSDKAGRFPTICVGLALCGGACILLGPLPWLPLPPEGHASMWVAMSVLGVGSALAFTPITPAILEAAEAKVLLWMH